MEYIHFFTVVLTEEEYYVNYHWHILSKELAGSVRLLLENSKCLGEFVQRGTDVLGKLPPLLCIERIFTGK